ncbi:2-oxoacid:acceptor oxidoreductase family protein [Candidatus Latescibacterota bacterium]
MARTEVRIAGFGGQGVILAGVLLGTAAVLKDGKHALQTQTYGAAARGGAARSDVIVSDDEIVYPQVTAPDIMVVFTTEALNKYKDDLRPDATLIIDGELVTPPTDTSFDIHIVPATKIAIEELGRGIVANMIMLGYLSALTGVVSTRSLEETIRLNVPKGSEELNLSAFGKGVALAENNR